MRTEKKTVYYRDPVHDDFAGTHIETNAIGGEYRYTHGRAWHWIANVLYYPIALPLVWLLHRVIFGIRFINRGARKKVKGPCFLYGNHTGIFDAYTPALLSCPRRAAILAGADAFSIRGVRTIVQMLGGIAIPNQVSGMKHFMEAVSDEFRKGHDIAIFPEAHIWPYYTGVRPFPATSFAYPVKMNVPVIAFFAAYSEPRRIDRLLGRKAAIRIYLSGPICPDTSLPYKKAQQKLRDEVYAFMEQTAKEYSAYTVIDYVQLPVEAEEKRSA